MSGIESETRLDLKIKLSNTELLRAFSERADLSWPQDAHENGLELSAFYPDRENPLFIVVAKPVRMPSLTKPGRLLWSKTPESPEVLEVITPRHDYGEEVLPSGVSGKHVHNTKVELFYPDGELILYLWNLKTGDKAQLPVGKRCGNTVYGILIKAGTVHAFQNGSRNETVRYTIISNMPEPEAIAKGEIIPVEIDLSSFPSFAL